MTSLLGSGPKGDQEPRLCSFPRGTKSGGKLASEFSARTSLFLDPWQQFALDAIMQSDSEGFWAAPTALVVVPRQNGKGAIDEAWALAQVFLNGCEIVLHTAHHAKTAKSAFIKMRKHIERSPLLHSRLKKDRSNGIRIANGEWGFTFDWNGIEQQLIYGTRTSGAGRGLTIGATVLDEVQELSDDELDALQPTMAAAPNPQMLMTGSAPKDKAEVLPRLMVAGRAGSDSELCYLEWSLDEHLRGLDLDDPAVWARANPGYGIRLGDRWIRNERRTMSDAGFARERLGMVAVEGANAFSAAWKRLIDRDSAITGLPTYALEVSEDRAKACVAAAGTGPAGLHVEAPLYRDGTGWIVDALADLAARRSVRVVVQPSSAAGSLISELEARRITVVRASLDDYRAACGQFYDSVTDSGDVRHLGEKSLEISARSADKKPSGDAWVWDRRTESTDISPLAAVTLAAWGSRQKRRPGRFIAF